MKSKYFLLFILFSSMVKAQVARNYFFPAKDKNESIFKSPASGSESKFDYNTKVFFKDMNDSALVTTMFSRDNAKAGGQEQLVKVSDSEISLVRGKANTSQGLMESYVASGEIVFKMPTENQKAEWSSPNQKGAVKTIYVAEFSKTKVNGKKEKAVKVSRIEKRKHSGKESVLYIDYYVAGIGRYKRTSESGTEIEILAEQTYDPNPPSVN